MAANNSQIQSSGATTPTPATDAKTASFPIESSVNSILEYGVRTRATDIHFEPRGESCLVRYRIDGKLSDSMALKSSVTGDAVRYLKTLAGLNTQIDELPQNGEFDADFGKLPVLFSISFMPTINGQKAVVHIINQTLEPRTIEALGMGSHETHDIKAYLASPHGLVIVASPDMLSRSTVLYSLLAGFNTKSYNIATLEKNVMHPLEGVNQTEIDRSLGLGMALALRNTLDQDANVVMVSDITDSASAELAVDSTLRGKIILAGLSTTSSVSALLRLADMGIEPFLVASTVKFVIASRLVRKLCMVCRQSYIPTGDELRQIKERVGELPKPSVAPTKSPYSESHAVLAHKKVIPAPSRDELQQRTILERIAKDPNIIDRGEKKPIIEVPVAEEPQADEQDTISTGNSEVSYYKAVGCEKCGGTGYLGQIALFEVLKINKAIQDALAAGKAELELEQLAIAAGMVPIIKDGFDKAAHGQTTINEVLHAL